MLVIGLDCATPELLFGDERLTNIRRLMEGGCYGRLESVNPPITVPAWMSMATSMDPGSLGVYGFRNRSDHSYDQLTTANSRSFRDLTVWDQVARTGGRTHLIAVPPGFPPRRVNGVSIGCFLTPDPAKDTYTHPASAADEIKRLVGEYPVDVKGFRTNNKDWLRDEIYAMSRKHFEVVRHYLKNTEWDFFQFVEIGVDRMHHGFWKCHDPQHVLHEPGNPYREVIRDYYCYLDDELGRLLELLIEDTAVLVASDHGAHRLDGSFCINEWLVREGLLVLDGKPKQPTPFHQLPVNWAKTRAWSEGGYYARVFINVKGREPSGVIAKDDCVKFRDELAARLSALTDENGRPMATQVFKPEEIYRRVHNVPPDLIVHLDSLYRRSVGSVGHGTLHLRENDTGPDDCNHSLSGAFILAASNNPLRGEVQDARLLDIAPTLLELGGYDIPETTQGRSLLSGKKAGSSGGSPLSANAEETVRQRLSGLGYA